MQTIHNILKIINLQKINQLNKRRSGKEEMAKHFYSSISF